MEILTASLLILLLLLWVTLRLARSIRHDGYGARPPETEAFWSPGTLPDTDYAGMYRIR